jgi:putative ABC transport system permease protein
VNPFVVFLVAARALLLNKMRSFLTALGIVIGVGAVIAMTAIGAGARARVEQTFAAMGTNMLVVRSGASNAGGVRGGAGTQPTLTWDDLAAIEREVPNARDVAPVLQSQAQLAVEGQNWSTSVQGTTPELFEIRNWQAAKGDLFDDGDVRAGAKVAVVGKTVADNLYGEGADPVGQVVRIGNVPFAIVGVMASKGQSAFGQDNDDVVFVPVSTYRAKLQGGLSKFLAGSIYVGTASQQATTAAQAEITDLLRERHKLAETEEDDFSVRNMAEIAAAQQEGTETMTSLLAGIALVSLLVGGIGIMNIMLVSVTERTREIGLRMAIGAKPRHVLVQFLVEAMLLSSLGGVLGVTAGIATASRLATQFGWPMLVQPQFVTLAVVFSALVGIGFGLYPAFKASRLDPIQALRHE